MKSIKKAAGAILLGIGILGISTVSYAGGAQKEKAAAYSFKAGATTITVGENAKDVLSALGKADKTFEQDSCAYQGKDKVYTYKGYELSTYPVKGVDKIASVYFLDKTVATPEGIRIGSSKEEALKAYGNNYKELAGVYRYVSGETELDIYTTNNVVDGIEYLVVTK